MKSASITTSINAPPTASPLVDRDTYMQAIEGAAKFLNGQADEIVQSLDEEMAQAADARNFERAAELRDRINAINHVLERQKIVSPNRDNADVVAIAKGEGGDAGVQVGLEGRPSALA